MGKSTETTNPLVNVGQTVISAQQNWVLEDSVAKNV